MGLGLLSQAAFRSLFGDWPLYEEQKPPDFDFEAVDENGELGLPATRHSQL